MSDDVCEVENCQRGAALYVLRRRTDGKRWRVCRRCAHELSAFDVYFVEKSPSLDQLKQLRRR